MKPAHRMIALQDWYDEGGILLISYDAVRLWVLNKATKKSAPPLSDHEYDIVKKQLLEGPSLVVADEAHHLKNLNSDISQAVKGIRTKSRIALTGSPLSNNLEEYYAMINWIAPDYLGGAPEFRAHYVEPIQHGFYQESTSYERRVAMKKLKTLEHILDPKIHRREVTVLKGRLKPKVEFVIKLGLTDIQRQAYDAFIDAVQSDEVTTAKLWAWMSMLTLLCNHPSLFWEKMKAKLDESQGPAKEPQNPLAVS
jgi:SNF2 family DNA or RNA helicase